MYFENEPAFNLLYNKKTAKLISAEELVRSMDRGKISASVVFGFPWRTTDLYKRHNDYVMEAAARHKSRLIPFCTFYPIDEGAANEAERCLQAGCAGIGEIAFYIAGLTPESCKAFSPVAAIAGERNVPIMLHANEPVGHYYPGKSHMTIREIHDFIGSFPNNRIILAHWGGGLFLYSLMKKSVKPLLQNTWFDTAASVFLYDERIYAVAESILGPERILFGSDYPLAKPARYFDEMNAAGLSRESMQKICGENAAALLGISSEDQG
jgi:hypothetical protein